DRIPASAADRERSLRPQVLEHFLQCVRIFRGWLVELDGAADLLKAQLFFQVREFRRKRHPRAAHDDVIPAVAGGNVFEGNDIRPAFLANGTAGDFLDWMGKLRRLNLETARDQLRFT